MAPVSHRVFQIDHNKFLLTPTKASLEPKLLHRAKVEGLPTQYIAITTIFWDKSSFTKDDLESVCHKYDREDDVWSRDFLSLVLLLQSSKLKCETSSKRILSVDNSQSKLPIGPLVVERLTGQIFTVAKLYHDTHSAFISSTLPMTKHKGTFAEFMRSEKVMVPVPSRLYFPKDKSKPLNGIRIAIKDTIALKGLPTSFGSKAWLEIYSAESSTAPCVENLTNAGAVIVGKVKTTEFAEGVDACEWLDTTCPYNPRGDGQQQSSSSSSGSAVAVAAYEWLDASVGTDTGGSIRHPAAVNGCFGQRPTHGRIDLTGVLGATDLFNTVGIFARDVNVFQKVGTYMVDNSTVDRLGSVKKKVNLLYPTRAAKITNPDQHHHGQHRWFPHPEVDQAVWTDAEKQIEQTVAAMEKLLSCKRIPFNINELWEATPVIGQSKNLDEAVGSIYSTITTSSALVNGIDGFISEYKERHDGRDPPMSEVVNARLSHGRNVTPDDVAKALESTQAFKEWTENTLFGSYDQDATTLLIFPQTCGRPAYRAHIPQRNELFNDTFSIYAFGYLVGCPDYTLPVAEVPYLSEITGKTEYLPASISLIGRPGTDVELFDIVQFLNENNALSNVAAGPRMFQHIE